MNNNTEVIFENIEDRILKEIQDAHYAIFVSVAWFTNKRLFNALLEKAKSNCYVSIIIQLDEINSQCGIDYGQIKIGRSECLEISKDTELLHDKFCVIDFKKVITGSYNWTYRASYNSENILILNDPSVAMQYISRFEQQKVKFKDSAVYKDLPELTTPHKVVVSTPAVASAPVNDRVIQPSSIIKKCPHCGSEIRNDAYCPHCGRAQSGTKKSTIVVTCKKCLRKQEEALIDAEGTKFCTFCGSDKLEWVCK